MTIRDVQKMLRMEPEIVSLDADSHAMFAAVALGMIYAGKSVKATLIAGPWKGAGQRAAAGKDKESA